MSCCVCWNQVSRAKYSVLATATPRRLSRIISSSIKEEPEGARSRVPRNASKCPSSGSLTSNRTFWLVHVYAKRHVDSTMKDTIQQARDLYSQTVVRPARIWALLILLSNSVQSRELSLTWGYPFIVQLWFGIHHLPQFWETLFSNKYFKCIRKWGKITTGLLSDFHSFDSWLVSSELCTRLHTFLLVLIYFKKQSTMYSSVNTFKKYRSINTPT